MSELLISVEQRIEQIVDQLAQDVKDKRLTDEEWLNLHAELDELRWTLNELSKGDVVV